MRSRVIHSYPRFLVLVAFLTLFCRDYALGSESRKGPRQTGDPVATATTQEPCDTTLEMLMGSAAPSLMWKQPPTQQYLNMQFEMPSDHGGRLEYIELVFYESGCSGTPDPDAYVWLSDGTFPLDTNPPSQAIAEFHVDYEDIEWFPGGTNVQAYYLGIEFDPNELFHVGVSHALEPGDTLAHLSDDGAHQAERASAWGGTAWESLAPYLYKMYVWICPSPIESTFTMRCSPSAAQASPADPPADLYEIDVEQTAGYDLNVTLSLLDVMPPADITATFAPNGIPPWYVADVAVTVGSDVPYDDYTLTFRGLGDDGQERICDAILRVQPPYACGNVNADGIVDVGDLVYLIGSLFRGGDAPDPECLGDVNCNGVIDIGDVVYLVSYLYKAGTAPCPDCCSLNVGG